MQIKLHSFFTKPSRLQLSTSRKILFVRRLSIYLKAGIPLLSCLDLVLGDTMNTRFTRMVLLISEDIKQGKSLSASFAVFPRVFSPWQIQLVSVGEETGTLPDSLEYLSTLLTRKHELQRTILGALLYPAIILLGTVGISCFLVFYSFPKIVPIFKGLKLSLPFSTKVLLWLTNIPLSTVLICVTVLVLVVITIRCVSVFPNIQIKIHALLLYVPGIRSLITYYCVASLFRTLAVLLRSGVRLDGALLLASTSNWHLQYKASLQNMRIAVLSGTKCSAAIKEDSRLYPGLVFQLVSAGESTGTLSESAGMISEMTEEYFIHALKSLTALLEPALMIFMGLVVGFIAMAILSPMYALTQGLSH